MKHTFKTNIHCSGCVAAVTPFLNASEDIKNWDVDIQSPQKILTVETDKLSSDKVKEIVEKAGYKAESTGQ